MFKKIAVFVFFLVIILFIFFNFFKKENKEEKISEIDTRPFNSNLLENVEYISKDAKGNQYIIRAVSGEIDLNNTNIIFLKDVTSIIKLTNSNEINIK